MAKRNSAHAQKRRVAAKSFSFREMTAKQKRIAALIVAVFLAIPYWRSRHVRQKPAAARKEAPHA